MLSWNRVDWLHMTHVSDFVLVKNDLFEGHGNAKEWWESLLSVVAEFPAFFVFVGLSYSITLFGSYDGLLEHLIKNVVIFDANCGCSLDEGEDNLMRGDFTLVHELNQLKSMRIFDDIFGLSRYYL